MIICFDLETTWLDKYNDEIIEVAMIKFDEKTFQIIDTFTSFVQPWIEIPQIITDITGISNSDVEGAPYIEEIKDDIIEFIGDTPVLWHNVFFDIDFFNKNGISLEKNGVIDTFFLANFLCFKNPSLNLEMLCDSFGIWFSWAHRAINDVKATIALFEKLLGSFQKLTQSKKELLFYVFEKSTDKNINLLQELLFDGQMFSIDFTQFEKKLLKKIWKYTWEKNDNLDNDIDKTTIEDMFDSIGKIEKRENQLKMTHVVKESLFDNHKTVIEAPTWLWKSFAYLIPSLLFSLQKNSKVFISTKTKALQDQLYDKDLQYLSDTLWFDFQYAKLKGKKNYLSVKLFFDELWIWDISYTKVWFLLKIILWLFETKYGELDELNYFWQEYSFLNFVNADSFWGASEKNDYKNYEYLYKARKSVEDANIVIINHSLLFSDIVSSAPILWDIKNLIIDEWHNIEDSITESLRKRYSISHLQEHFEVIEKILDKTQSKKIEYVKIKEIIISNLELIDDYWSQYINRYIQNDSVYKNCLIKQDFYNEYQLSEIVKKIELSLLDIIDILSVIKEYDFSKECWILKDILDSLKIVLDNKNEDKYIKIINYNDRNGLSFDYTLLNPGKYLSDNIWTALDSCVLTSATLKIWESFDYIKNILHLDEFTFHSFKSDFDYQKQATLFIPTDLGNIKNNSEKIVNFLWRFYSIVQWRVLTLLTSYNIIRKIYSSLNGDLKKQWITLFPQWIAGSKIKLVSFYMKDPWSSILLWTDSFWEGIDIPWDNLKYLIIHKFPFAVPTDPIFQARSIFFKDPFLEYSVPKAIIKLKQWFGRLIRSKDDSWVVILLDDRIISTSWWNNFFDAFPSEINIKKWTSHSLFNALEMKNE